MNDNYTIRRSEERVINDLRVADEVKRSKYHHFSVELDRTATFPCRTRERWLLDTWITPAEDSPGLQTAEHLNLL